MNTLKMPGFTGEASLYRITVQYRMIGGADGMISSQGLLPQLQNEGTIWTTSQICEACGCTVSGFQCNCGLRPDPRKVDCINNGGPTKLAVFNSGTFGSSISRSKLA